MEDSVSKEKEKLELIKKYADQFLRSDFDFNVEHWKWGNVDDSLEYGIKCGEQYILQDIKDIIDGKMTSKKEKI